jgi:hypothetical protein
MSGCNHREAEWHWPFGKEGDLTQMNKLMTAMLGLALVAGTASYSFAQDKAPKTTTKKGGKGVCADKSKVGKDGKCKDGSAPTPAPAKAKADKTTK